MKVIVFLLATLVALFFAFLILVDSVHAQDGTLAIPSQAPTFGISWLTLAMINAGLAQGKNRSGLFWGLLSLLLGPLATFILVVFVKKGPYRP
jgi:hypothetical protein